jgi:3-methyl-2-oxobutanoate hydroxymethyltransferase
MSEATNERRRKLSSRDVALRKGGEPLVMLSLHDAVMARHAEAVGVDMILVGDSVGTVMLGMESTTPVTLEMIEHHASAVRRGAPKTHVVADLTFGSYQVSNEQAIESASRLIKFAHADAVKLEGGAEMVERIAAITRAGIPVMGHIGLLPQTAQITGGYRVQGRDITTAKRLIEDAKAVEAAGAYGVVIELVPEELAARITTEIGIPTIGIGAGAGCDGQVLVASDLLGNDETFQPRFLKKYANISEIIRTAFREYASDVRGHAYPGREHVTHLPDETLDALKQAE